MVSIPLLLILPWPRRVPSDFTSARRIRWPGLSAHAASDRGSGSGRLRNRKASWAGEGIFPGPWWGRNILGEGINGIRTPGIGRWVLINFGDKEIHATMLPITVGNSFSQSTETKGRIPLHQRFNSHTGISVPWSLHNLVIWRQAALQTTYQSSVEEELQQRLWPGKSFLDWKTWKPSQQMDVPKWSKMCQTIIIRFPWPDHHCIPWNLWPFVWLRLIAPNWLSSTAWRQLLVGPPSQIKWEPEMLHIWLGFSLS